MEFQGISGRNTWYACFFTIFPVNNKKFLCNPSHPIIKSQDICYAENLLLVISTEPTNGYLVMLNHVLLPSGILWADFWMGYVYREAVLTGCFPYPHLCKVCCYRFITSGHHLTEHNG